MHTNLDQLTSGSQVHSQALHHLQRLATNKAPYVSSLRIGGQLSRKRGSGLEFNQLREYTYGDDPRFIDWKASSRFNTIYTKEFIEDKDANCLIVIDLQDSMYFGSRKRYLSVLACYSAALVAWRWHKQGYAIAFTLINSQRVTDFKATRRESELRHRLDNIAEIHNSTKPQQTHSALDSHLKPQAWNKFEHLILITNSLNVDKSVTESFAYKRGKKHRLLVKLEDPMWHNLSSYNLLSDGHQSVNSSELEKYTEVEQRLQLNAKHNGLQTISASTESDIFSIAGQLQELS